MKTRVMKKKSSAGHTKRSRKARRSLSWKAMVVAGIVLGGSAWAVTRFREDGGFLRPAVKVPAPEEVPSIDPERMEKRVVQRVEAARAKVLADRSSGEAWGNYGIVLDAHEIYEPAVFAYRTAYALEPKDFRWPYLLARVIKFTDGDDSPEIVGFYEAAMKIRPDYAPLQVRYGDALMRLNRVEDARKAYERALKLEPSLWIAHRGMGQALIQAGEGSAAVMHLERAATLRPEDGVSQASLARAYLLAGQKEKAAQAASSSLALKQIHTWNDPALDEVGTVGVSSSTCLRRGRELINLGRYQEALLNLRIAEEVLKDHALLLASFGACYHGMGQPDRAIEYFERSLAIKDEDPNHHVQLGSVLVGQRRYPKAIVHFRRALEMADTPENRTHLASALAHDGQLALAAAEFEKAVAAGAKLDALAQNNWGSVLARQGLYSQAIPHFAEAARQDPDFASAYFNWGRALEDDGNLGEALRLFEIAARFDPKGPAVRRIHELTANPQDKR